MHIYLFSAQINLERKMNMQDRNTRPEVPLGLGYALAMNNSALQKFAEMSEEHRKQVIEESRGIASKQEMRQFVENLNTRKW